MSNKPAHELRLGRVRATLWQNATEAGPRFSVTFSRAYKDAEGAWKDSASFSRDDLPLLGKVADLAHTWLYQVARGAAPAGSSDPAEDPPIELP